MHLPSTTCILFRDGPQARGGRLACQTRFAPRDLASWWDANGQVGGPIARDRLWFFAGLGVIREPYRPFGYSGPEQADRREPQGLVTLDAAPTDDLRLQGFYQHSAGTIVGEQLSTFQPALDVAGRRRWRNHTWNARGTWLPRPDTAIEARIGGLVGYSAFGPADPARAAGPPPKADFFLGTLADNVLTMTDDDRQMVTTTARVSHVRRIGVSLHDLAAGVEFEGTSSRAFYGQPGNRLDQYFDGVYQSTTLWPGEDIRTRRRDLEPPHRAAGPLRPLPRHALLADLLLARQVWPGRARRGCHPARRDVRRAVAIRRRSACVPDRSCAEAVARRSVLHRR